MLLTGRLHIMLLFVCCVLAVCCAKREQKGIKKSGKTSSASEDDDALGSNESSDDDSSLGSDSASEYDSDSLFGTSTPDYDDFGYGGTQGFGSPGSGFGYVPGSGFSPGFGRTPGFGGFGRTPGFGGFGRTPGFGGFGRTPGFGRTQPPSRTRPPGRTRPPSRTRPPTTPFSQGQRPHAKIGRWDGRSNVDAESGDWRVRSLPTPTLVPNPTAPSTDQNDFRESCKKVGRRLWEFVYTKDAKGEGKCTVVSGGRLRLVNRHSVVGLERLKSLCRPFNDNWDGKSLAKGSSKNCNLTMKPGMYKVKFQGPSSNAATFTLSVVVERSGPPIPTPTPSPGGRP